jgi:DNA-directed RNA polymerase subunit RPC12/RpoP
MIKPKQNVEIKCDKCSGTVVKTGVMQSGNSKYEYYTCKSCGHKGMKCTGLM